MNGYLAQARQDAMVEAALALARTWCQGHVIDGAPALSHAVKVTALFGTHCPAAPAHVVAALLLHDAPDLAPDPSAMAEEITRRCGAEALAFIQALHAEHAVLDNPEPAAVTAHLATLTGTSWLLEAAVADKIIAFRYMTGRADRAEDREEFWAQRRAFVRLLPYFHQIGDLAAGRVPEPMTRLYRTLLDRCPTPAVYGRSAPKT
ncbi:hypothetical protein ACTWQF_34190 [Streptomyces sp. 8N114]|uniref:hypothetical protein n=1 Tax=Streptomyces sp. 8N114 TaxID=3457419 RepID=UPI003FD2F07F